MGPVISLLSVVIVVAIAAGVAYAFVAVPAQTQLQEELPEAVRGRVFGVLNSLVSVASFVPILAVGPIADLVGTSTVVQGSAVITLLVAVGSILRAHPTHEGPASEAVLIDAVDPVSVTGRPLTTPTALRSEDESGDGPIEVLEASPVIPGHPGPTHEPHGGTPAQGSEG
jgi:MFS family permease